jgi:hypothetical protein
MDGLNLAQQSSNDNSTISLLDFAEFAPPTSEEFGVAIPELFANAINSRLRGPKIQIRLVTPVGHVLVLKRAGTRSKWPGSVRITDDEGTYFGAIGIDGMLYPSSLMTPDIRAALERLAGDTVGAALDYAKLSGRCCFCNYRLTDARSVAHGYGPDCAARFKLPWCAPRHTHGLFGNAWSLLCAAPGEKV